MSACRLCGVETLAGARFCHGCGAAVAPIDPAAEYKQVTVLFADVVRSMDIAARVGPERLREIMAALVDRAAGIVRGHGGTLDKFTGDGFMALFGAPIALEDHAVRACRAALDIQRAVADLADEIRSRDGITLRARVGLNSGQVITGEVGTAATGYTAVGEQVGMAQRMESAAPPGGIMLSESTARLVEAVARLDEPQSATVKGTRDPVIARRLIDLPARQSCLRRRDGRLVGRSWEMAAVGGLFDRVVGNQGAVATVIGPPGIGKSRLVREVEAIAARQSVPVFSTFCESHTSQIPLHVVTALLRAATGVEGLEPAAARDHLRAQALDSEAADLLLVEDMLGIADPSVVLPAIDPDARRRRLTAVVKAALLARETPAVYVVEDAHWIDEVSEAMLADFLSVIPQTPSLVLITCRPEYPGALIRLPGSQTIALAPLSLSEATDQVSALLGPDPALTGLGRVITERAAGNPFFAEEIVRELTGRGVLVGDRGDYRAGSGLGDVTVPATLQATIAARIDHLNPEAKHTLNAAAVIGTRFSFGTLSALVADPDLEVLLRAQLIDQVRFAGDPEYVFHHPLIRAVAYESQLKADRMRSHRRLAEVLGGAGTADDNAALIAEHYEAAGDLREAYAWHMRAAESASTRDILAAMAGWQRAARVADALPEDDDSILALRIAPRTALCMTSWRRFHEDISGLVEEMRELCARAGDKASLAIALAGLAIERLSQNQLGEASHLAYECVGLAESLDDPVLVVALSPTVCIVQMQAGQFGEAFRLSQNVIDLADGDPTFGDLIVGSPLTMCLAFRGALRAVLGIDGWKQDFDHASALAGQADPITVSTVITYHQILAIRGTEIIDDDAIAEIDRAVQIAEQSGEDVAVVMVKLVSGLVRMQAGDAYRAQALATLAEVRETCLRERYGLQVLPYCEVVAARGEAAIGGLDGAIRRLRAATDGTIASGNLGVYDFALLAFVETLLSRGTPSDIAAAEAEIDRYSSLPADFPWSSRTMLIARLRALIARAQGDDAGYRQYRDSFRDLARRLGFEGSVAQADAMP